MTKNQTKCLDVLGISYTEVTLNDTDYIVTEGTGEGTYAYLADDIAEESKRYHSLPEEQKEEYDYSENFCSQCSPEHDRELAIALAAREELWIYSGGCATPVLTKKEYDLVRAVVNALT